jgi:hypothetical protein
MDFPWLSNATFAIAYNWLVWGIWFITNVAFAIAVARHARGRATAFVGRTLWVLATLLGGPTVALAYWLMNASSLVPTVKPSGSAP